MTNCKSLMTTNVTTCEVNDTVLDVARKMSLINVGSIPIVESADSNKLVGIITDRDIVLRVVVHSLDPQTTPVSHAMTHQIVTCKPDDDLISALRKMGEYQIRRLPVVDDEGTLVGIIAQADIARHADAESTGEVVGEISEALPLKI